MFRWLSGRSADEWSELVIAFWGKSAPRWQWVPLHWVRSPWWGGGRGKRVSKKTRTFLCKSRLAQLCVQVLSEKQVFCACSPAGQDPSVVDCWSSITPLARAPANWSWLITEKTCRWLLPLSHPAWNMVEKAHEGCFKILWIKNHCFQSHTYP